MTNMEPVVLSLGGSILVKDDGDSDYVKKLSEMLVSVSSSHKLYVVTGGGRIARYYIRTGRALGADERSLDEIGIEVTRLNARLLITALGGKASGTVPKDYAEAERVGRTFPIVVMGGVSPGITTDAVSAILAEHVKAKRLVNATSVDAAYTSDPEKDPSAKRIPNMTHKALIDLVSSTPSGAGPNAVFDMAGAKVLEKSRISLAIVQGRDIPNLRAALEGKTFKGTIVH